MSRLKQSLVWWCYAHNEVTPQHLVRAAAEIGYRAIDLVDEAYWPLVKDHGLEIASIVGHASIAAASKIYLFALYHTHPFIFLSNGYEHWFWDREQKTVPRPISGFFAPADLERLAFLNVYRQPLQKLTINEEIAGKGRSYQRTAIQRIVDAMEQDKKRKFLLVMATRTGKTRTVVALVDLLIRARSYLITTWGTYCRTRRLHLKMHISRLDVLEARGMQPEMAIS